ncbi:molybdenum ABC transporter ATP-binding protein [Pseudomaricurvus sp. HS19]|uniref:molybdenum ABC transporter ATP-binding protein n=1 Tax=Pseudomaricurvus sp. HS19 TaxID=2692626 RepID=UPI001925AD1D|nr:molybdenum ABC transporter ATP-binding protein [Pseudomaricurvus sp. HS19]
MSINARFHLQYPDFSLQADLQLPATGVSVLFGHSGSGKTTLLRCIAGLQRAQEGELSFRGEVWQSAGHFLPTHKRPIGYVFQEASLLSHLTAQGNLDYAIKRAPVVDQPIQLQQAIELLGIGHLLKRRPEQLSGGERQRVAIARALLIQPQLLLMDEPLAALDTARKLEILPYLEKLKRELKLPILYVTHSPDEVAKLADYLVAMENGRVLAAGTLSDTLARLDFPIKLGEEAGVVLEGVVTELDAQWQLVKVQCLGGPVWLRDSGNDLHSLVRVRILARDVSLSASLHNDTSIINVLPAEVTDISVDEHEGLALVKLKITSSSTGTDTGSSSFLISRVTRRSAHLLGLEIGKRVWAQIKSVAVI